MKRLLSYIFVIICSVAFAQVDSPKVTSRTSTLGEDITSVLGQLNDKPITQRRSDLLWSKEQLPSCSRASSACFMKKQEASYEAQVKDYTTRMAPYTAKCEYHDAHQCMNVCENDLQHCDNRCAWYHQEMLDLQAQGQAFTKEHDDLEKTKELLDTAEKTNAAAWDEWLTIAKPWAIKAVAAEKQYKALYGRLQDLKSRYGDCSKTAGSLETLKHTCGNIQFDGADKSLDDLNTVKPPFRVIPN